MNSTVLFTRNNQLLNLCQLFFNFRRLEWKNFEVVITDRKTIEVKNVSNDAKEKLDFRDRIIKASLAFKHLVVATSSQCYIYTYVPLFLLMKNLPKQGMQFATILSLPISTLCFRSLHS